MRDDGAGERDGLGPQALGETLVQDTLVSPVLVEDYQLLSLLGRLAMGMLSPKPVTLRGAK